MPVNLLPPNWTQTSLADIAQLAPVEILRWPSIAAFGVEVALKRDELLHPHFSGNKFYKLHGYINAFQSSGKSVALSFGGAFSNHLYALAAAGSLLKFPTIGVIRGERPSRLSPTLLDLQALGMRLHFVSREAYRYKLDPVWLDELRCELGDFFCIPEGGGGVLGAQGCVEWGSAALKVCPWRPDYACVAAGTGATAAGLSVGLNHIPLHVFMSLKGTSDALTQFGDNIALLQQDLLKPRHIKPTQTPSISLEANYHCGGYAKFPVELRNFVERFEAETGVLLDPVYTAKMFWGIWQKVSSGEWAERSKILAFHSGGLQGRRGFN